MTLIFNWILILCKPKRHLLIDNNCHPSQLTTGHSQRTAKLPLKLSLLFLQNIELHYWILQVSFNVSVTKRFFQVALSLRGRNAARAHQGKLYKRYDRGLLTIDGNSSPWPMASIGHYTTHDAPGVPMSTYLVPRWVTVSWRTGNKAISPKRTMDIYLIVPARGRYTELQYTFFKWPTGIHADGGSLLSRGMSRRFSRLPPLSRKIYFVLTKPLPPFVVWNLRWKWCN